MCRQLHDPPTKDEPSQNRLNHLYLNHAEVASSQLVGIGVSCEDTPTTEIQWLPDSGTDVDAISVADLDQLDPDLKWNLARDTQSVSTANGGSLGPRGTLDIQLHLNAEQCAATLHVYSKIKTSLLSKSSCVKVGLLEDGWPQSRIQQDQIGRLSVLLISEAEDAMSAQSRREPNSTTSVEDKHEDVDALREAIVRDLSEAFADEPLRPMVGPPMHIDLTEGAIPCRHFKARSIPFRWR